MHPEPPAPEPGPGGPGPAHGVPARSRGCPAAPAGTAPLGGGVAVCCLARPASALRGACCTPKPQRHGTQGRVPTQHRGPSPVVSALRLDAWASSRPGRVVTRPPPAHAPGLRARPPDRSRVSSWPRAGQRGARMSCSVSRRSPAAALAPRPPVPPGRGLRGPRAASDAGLRHERSEEKGVAQVDVTSRSSGRDRRQLASRFAPERRGWRRRHVVVLPLLTHVPWAAARARQKLRREGGCQRPSAPGTRPRARAWVFPAGQGGRPLLFH